MLYIEKGSFLVVDDNAIDADLVERALRKNAGLVAKVEIIPEDAERRLRDEDEEFGGLIVDGLNGRCHEIIAIAISLGIPNTRIAIYTGEPAEYEDVARKFNVRVIEKGSEGNSPNLINWVIKATSL